MVGKSASRFVLTGVSVALLCGVSSAPALAKGTGTTSPTGIDVSHVQCSSTTPSAVAQPLPSGQAFAVIGVNGGLANDYNSCLGAEFSYAQGLAGTTHQKAAQTYLNTADPGNGVADWPSPSQLGAYGTTATPSTGTCDFATAGATSGPGANSPACAYIYGYDMVAGLTYSGGSIAGDLRAFSDATGGGTLPAQPVWLDVETTNSWQTSAAMNTADLQGMVDALTRAASSGTAQIGIYSTSSQWGQITGTSAGTPSAGNLAALPVWIPGARSQKGAVANCSQTAFTSRAAAVSIAQWFGQTYDGDDSCVG